MPVAISARPEPSRSTLTEMSVSLVLRVTLAVRIGRSFVARAFYQAGAECAT